MNNKASTVNGMDGDVDEGGGPCGVSCATATISRCNEAIARLELEIDSTDAVVAAHDAAVIARNAALRARREAAAIIAAESEEPAPSSRSR